MSIPSRRVDLVDISSGDRIRPLLDRQGIDAHELLLLVEREITRATEAALDDLRFETVLANRASTP